MTKGASVGVRVGNSLGVLVGVSVGESVGDIVGTLETKVNTGARVVVGTAVGESVGTFVGLSEGVNEGIVVDGAGVVASASGEPVKHSAVHTRRRGNAGSGWNAPLCTSVTRTCADAKGWRPKNESFTTSE
jgi:hypothetical protein